MKKLLCRLIGHKLIVINDIIDAASPDRMCLRCNAINYSPPPAPGLWFDASLDYTR